MKQKEHLRYTAIFLISRVNKTYSVADFPATLFFNMKLAPDNER